MPSLPYAPPPFSLCLTTLLSTLLCVFFIYPDVTSSPFTAFFHALGSCPASTRLLCTPASIWVLPMVGTSKDRKARAERRPDINPFSLYLCRVTVWKMAFSSPKATPLVGWPSTSSSAGMTWDIVCSHEGGSFLLLVAPREVHHFLLLCLKPWSSWPGDGSCTPCISFIGRCILYHWDTWEASNSA